MDHLPPIISQVLQEGQVVRTKERTIVLGESLSDFMRKLDIVPTGGRWGTISALKKQTTSLFSASIRAVYDDDSRFSMQSASVAESTDLWWNPKSPDQIGLFASTVTLSETFYRATIRDYPVPVDMHVLRHLRQSPLALDIYCWLTHRMSYLKQPTSIPWEALQLQFGADYKQTKTFKFYFLKHLKNVLAVG